MNNVESKTIKSLKAKITEEEQKHERLAKEIIQHHSNSVTWQELMSEYMKAADQIGVLKKKLALYKKYGKIYGKKESMDTFMLGNRAVQD